MSAPSAAWVSDRAPRALNGRQPERHQTLKGILGFQVFGLRLFWVASVVVEAVLYTVCRIPHLAHEVERPPDWHVGSPPGWRPGPRNERALSLPSQLQAKLDAVFREPSPDPPLPEDGLIREPVTANAQSSANASTHSAASYATPPRTGSRALSCSSHGHGPFAPCPGQVALDPGPWQIPSWPQAQPPAQLPAQPGPSPNRSLLAMSTAPVTEPLLEVPWTCFCPQPLLAPSVTDAEG